MRRAAVVGCGSIGQRHIGNLRRLGVTDITALRTRQGHAQALDPALEVKEVDDWADLLAGRPDIAIVSNPTSMHVETARKLLPHVRGLFMEKPIAAAIDDDGRLLMAEAEELRAHRLRRL